MSGMRFRQIQQTGIITDRIANRLNQIEGMEIFKPNHPRLGGQRSKEKAWNDEHQFKPDSQYFRLFVEYFMEWAFSGRNLGE